MRRVLSFGLVMAVACAGAPIGAYAQGPATDSTGSVRGTAQGADNAPLRNYSVRVRNLADGQIAGKTTSSGAGEFSFADLAAGSYVVEVLDAAGQVVGVSPTLSVTAGGAMNITISASAAGVMTASDDDHKGFSLFGLGTVGTVAILTAAGVAGVTAVIATQNDASPSR